ncbi:MAG: hypothetical protein H7836_15375 [Magnetococcus sp. YQC-3]
MKQDRHKLTSQQWIALNRLELSMEYWLNAKLKVYWITLTSSPNSPDLYSSFKELLKRVERTWQYRPEYMRVKTSEGFGVLHCFFVFKGRGMPNAYQWLRETWEDIHGAWNVSIRTIGMMGHDAQRVARYAVTQYAIGSQGTSFVRCDWSRFTHLPFSVTEHLKNCRHLLRNDVHHWTPWHATYKMVKDCARALLLHGVYECKTGHVIGMDFMTQKPIVLSSPLDLKIG